jgi:hypothetical protein
MGHPPRQGKVPAFFAGIPAAGGTRLAHKMDNTHRYEQCQFGGVNPAACPACSSRGPRAPTHDGGPSFYTGGRSYILRTLCYTPSDTLHYKTHVSIYVLYPFRAQAGWVASRLVVLVVSASKDHKRSTGRCRCTRARGRG